MAYVEAEKANQYKLAYPERNRIADLIEYGHAVPDVKPIPFEHDNSLEHQSKCMNCQRVAKLMHLSLPFDRDSLKTVLIRRF